MSTEIKSNDPCPVCLLQNTVVNQLMNLPGQFYTNCKAGHQFNDTEELNMLRLQARAKYPNLYRGNEAMPTDPAVFADRDIVISAEMKKTIEEVCGISFTGAADLKGTIFALAQDNKDQEAEIKSLNARLAMMSRKRGPEQSGGAPVAGLGPNQFIVDLPEWAMDGGVAEQAAHAGMTPQEWINQEISGYFEQYFGTPQGRR